MKVSENRRSNERAGRPQSPIARRRDSYETALEAEARKTSVLLEERISRHRHDFGWHVSEKFVQITPHRGAEP